MTRRQPSIAQFVQAACAAEVCAPKAGNVHPGADFDDVTWRDFLTSAAAIAPLLQSAADAGVGPTVLACVRATIDAVGTNTNLGIILLLAPLCAVPPEVAWDTGLSKVLGALDQRDAETVYEAIRLARPGGLGASDAADVRHAPTLSLLDAMRQAADRDAIARQYVTGFADVLGFVAPRLAARVSARQTLEQAVVGVHLELMAREPDSLIVRKCGRAIGLEAQKRAAAVLDADWPHTAEARRRFAELDAYLRADGHRRNPGASADLIAAGLYAALRDGRVRAPESRRCAS